MRGRRNSSHACFGRTKDDKIRGASNHTGEFAAGALLVYAFPLPGDQNRDLDLRIMHVHNCAQLSKITYPTYLKLRGFRLQGRRMPFNDEAKINLGSKGEVVLSTPVYP